MGLLDSLLKNMQQGGQGGQGGGDLSKSLTDALNSVLTGGAQAPPASQSPAPASPGRQAAGQQDDLVAGIAEMVEKLQKAGYGVAVKTWIGTGENAPIGPEPLKKALGGGAVKDLANQSGLPEQELMTQLSKALPGLIDRLTPNGRLPQSWQELITDLQQQQPQR